MVLMMFLLNDSLAQSDFLSVFDRGMCTGSIIRPYQNGDLIYVENISTSGNQIIQCDNRFILTNPNTPFGIEARLNMPSLPALKWKINDMKILGDTAYFCGYQYDNGDMWGFIGYFSIPALFDESGQIQVKRFYPYILRNDFKYKIVSVSKMELLPVSNGLHILSTGSYLDTIEYRDANGVSHVDTVWNSFIADIVHSYRSGAWWYYVHLGGMECFSDVAIADTHAVSIAYKLNHNNWYLRMYDKPHAVTHQSDFRNDASFFYSSNPSFTLPGYPCIWFSEASNLGFNPRIYEPLIAHTEADSVAIAYLSHEWNDRQGFVFGASVSHFALSNFRSRLPEPALQINTNRWRERIMAATVDASGGLVGDAIAPIEGWNSSMSDSGLVMPDYDVPIYYHRMIVQHQSSEIDSLRVFSLKDIAYNGTDGRLYLLQRKYYSPSLFDTTGHYELYSFNIHDSTDWVKEYNPPAIRYVKSIAEGQLQGNAMRNPAGCLSISGCGSRNNSNTPFWWRAACSSFSCMDGVNRIRTIRPKGIWGGYINYATGSVFDYERVDYVADRLRAQVHSAFQDISIGVKIINNGCYIECQE